MPGCIYQIVIIGGSRTYIGSARSLRQRKYAHLCLLRKGSHHCRALQNAVTKHGLGAIEWRLLETVDDCKNLIEREQAWLDRFNGRLYNKSPTAASRLGATMSDEACAKISASLRGNQRRKGLSFTTEQKRIISASVRSSYQNGRRVPSPNPKNLSSFNAAVKRGEKLHPSRNPARDAAIVEHHAVSRSLKQTGNAFAITAGAVWCVVRRCNPSQLRKWRRK